MFETGYNENALWDGITISTYGAILAGGIGARMQRTGLPKQFLPLGGKPVILHTFEQFQMHPLIEIVYLVVPNEWVSFAEDLFAGQEKARVIEGGSDRNGSLMASVSAIRSEYGVSDDDILVSHDAVRPFITQRILDDNISAGIEFGAADTVIAASDTIVEAVDDFIINVPVRSRMYQGQTPQTFNIKLLESVYASLTDEEKAVLTDACKMFVIKGKTVRLVRGEGFNIKITTPFDLEVANALLRGEKL